MKRLFASLALSFFVTACQEEKAEPHVSPAVWATEVPVHPSALQNEIDWGEEISLSQSEDLFQRASVIAGVEVGELKSAIKIVAKVHAQKIEFSATHPNSAIAEEWCKATSSVFLQIRSERHAQQLEAQLSDLNAAREPTEAEIIEQDRMTYEKAKNALLDEDEGLKNGVLFKKETE